MLLVSKYANHCYHQFLRYKLQQKKRDGSIKIDPSGVTIKGPMIKVQGTAMAEVKAPLTTVKADAMLTLKGGITMIN